MNQFYDEDTANEDYSKNLYYTIRDAVSQVLSAEIPLSLAGIAQGIADELDIQKLNELMLELDKQIDVKINANAEIRVREYVNKRIDKLISESV